MSEKNPACGLALFLTAAIVTFGCLTVMQFLEKPWFFVALVAMHAGIALFVVSKRVLRKQEFDLLRYFKSEYAMLLPFFADHGLLADLEDRRVAALRLREGVDHARVRAHLLRGDVLELPPHASRCASAGGDRRSTDPCARRARRLKRRAPNPQRRE